MVSAYGRANWMSLELASRGYKVAIIDFSASMGPWAPEDWEGPFGLFQSESLTPTQWARLTHEEYQDEVEEGFVVWADGGPIDFRGPLRAFWSQNLKAYELLEKALLNAEKVGLDEPFQKAWLLNLAHQLAGSRFLLNGQARESRQISGLRQSLSLFAPYFIRRVSRKGLLKGLEQCKQHGVDVFEGQEVVDLLIENKKLTGVEVRSEWSGLLKSESLVWFFSSEETKWRTPKVFDRLCPSGELQAEWSWVRYRVGFDFNPTEQYLPLKFVVIDDKEAPWAHANLLVCQQTTRQSDLDVWLRMPAQFRFNRNYLDSLAQDLIRVLTKKVKGSNFVIVDMPQDYLYEGQQLGPSLFSVFTDGAKFKPSTLPNIFWAGPESQNLIDWTGALEKDLSVLNRLVMFLEKQKKKEASVDSAIHAP